MTLGNTKRSGMVLLPQNSNTVKNRLLVMLALILSYTHNDIFQWILVYWGMLFR